MSAAVFLVGAERSGTTLLRLMLDVRTAAAGLWRARTDRELGWAELALAQGRLLKWLGIEEESP